MDKDKLSSLFFRKPTIVPDVCVFSSEEKQLIDYNQKEDRSQPIVFAGIGRTTYASGIPPAIYDNSISAAKGFPIVYGCISAISEAIAGLGVKVYELQGGQKIEVLDHPFYQMFANPNPWQGSFEFMEQLQQSLDVTGNCFISKEVVAGALEFYILPSKYVAITPDPKLKIKEYIFYINGQKVIYKQEEIIHIKYTNVDDPYFGMPPLSTATDIITFEKNRIKFLNQFFVNGAIPVGVLETEQNLGEPLLKKLRGEWSTIHQGVNNSHKMAILQSGLKYKAIASPIKDLDFTGLKKLSKDDILTIFKIPESILGSQDGTGSSEGKAAITAFWRQCLIPRIKRIESSLNRGLKLDIFANGTFCFEFNLKDVVALQDDKREIADYLEKMVGASIMKPNEARAIIGLPRDEDPYADQLLVSNSFFGSALMPVSDALNGGAGSTTEKPAAKPAKATDPAVPPAAKKPTGKPVPAVPPAKKVVPAPAKKPGAAKP
jgi:HK97 family phage portal protein